MKIGKVAERTGVSRDTIRLYEKRGLLKDVTRPHEFNNYKEYGEKNVERIQSILMMKNIGLTLKECKTILTMVENDQFDREFRDAFLNKKLKQIDEKIEELLHFKKTLQQHLGGDCSGQVARDALTEEA